MQLNIETLEPFLRVVWHRLSMCLSPLWDVNLWHSLHVIFLFCIFYLYESPLLHLYLYLYLYRSPLVWHRLSVLLSPLCDSLWRKLSPFSLIFSPAPWESGMDLTLCKFMLYLHLYFHTNFVWISIGLRFCICICMDLPFCDVSCGLFSGTVHNSLITTSLCPM